MTSHTVPKISHALSKKKGHGKKNMKGSDVLRRDYARPGSTVIFLKTPGSHPPSNGHPMAIIGVLKVRRSQPSLLNHGDFEKLHVRGESMRAWSLCPLSMHNSKMGGQWEKGLGV